MKSCPVSPNRKAQFRGHGLECGDPRLFSGLIGDGDLFREEFGRRELAASHFDRFVDFDGNLDLFKGGVEPFVFDNI